MNTQIPEKVCECKDENGKCKYESCEDCKQDGFHGLACPCRDRDTKQSSVQEYDFALKALEPELETWKLQGRSKDQIWAVENFLTGQGLIGLKRVIEAARKEERKKTLKLFAGAKDFAERFEEVMKDLGGSAPHNT